MKKNTNGTRIAIASALAALCVGTATVFTGCGDMNVYDDDNGILTSSSSSAVLMNETKVNNIFKVSAKSFTGVETVYTFSANNGLTVSYDAELTSGRVKLVICDNANIINIFECTADSTAATATDKYIPLDAGSYRIRLVGDNAEFGINSFTYTAD